MSHELLSEDLSTADLDSTNDRTCGIDSRHMKKAALYARVSTDGQQKDGTIQSQLAELRKQVAAAGHQLVKEYIDDGYSGLLLDRPGLDQMRTDAKSSVYDAIHFLDADRITRDVSYQRIIISELLKRGKEIIIKGKNYVDIPENKFTVTVLGAVAELERAKIIERTTRGRLHKLRRGELSSNGHRIYGYDYIRKTATAPAALVVNEEQAAVVRTIFEMFASGEYRLVNIARFLEKSGIRTRLGRSRWDFSQVKSMLKNETYTGVRYFNRITAATDAAKEAKRVFKGRWMFRDRADWIAVAVPAIVTRELFDAVQARLRTHNERYCQPVTRHLLSGLVQCGVCGSACSSSRRYHKVRRQSGKVSLYHNAFYRCNRQAGSFYHEPSQREPCTNARIATHILEGKVFELIAETMIDPGKLRGCIAESTTESGGTTKALRRIAKKIGALDDERRQLNYRYAADEISGDEFIAASRALDEKLARLMLEKSKLAAVLRSPAHEDFVDACVRQFCANAKARLQTCADEEAKRSILLDHIELVIYDHYEVTLIGSVPLHTATGSTKLPFRIVGAINIKKVRSEAQRKAALQQWHVEMAAEEKSSAVGAAV
jgi:site-specific DNA recombinase